MSSTPGTITRPRRFAGGVHGPHGTGAMIAEQREAFAWLRSQVREQKAAGKSVDDAVKQLTPEFEKAHPGWMNTNRAGAIIRGMYSE